MSRKRPPLTPWLASLVFAVACAPASGRPAAGGATRAGSAAAEAQQLCPAPASPEASTLINRDEPGGPPANFSMDLDARRVALLDAHGKVQVRDGQTGQMLAQGDLTCDGEPAPCDDPRPRDIELVTGHNTLTVLWHDRVSLWSISPLRRRATLGPGLQNSQRLVTLARHGELAVRILPDERSLVTHSATSEAEVARARWQWPAATPDGATFFVDSWPAISPTFLLQVGPHLQLWEASSLKLLSTFRDAAGVMTVRSPDRRHVLLLSSTPRQIFIDAQSGKTIFDLQLKTQEAPQQSTVHQSVGFTRDGSLLGFTTLVQKLNGQLASTVVTLIESRDGKVRHRVSLPPAWETRQPPGFSTSGRQFCWRGNGSCMAAIDTITGEPVPPEKFERFIEPLPSAHTYGDVTMAFDDAHFEVSRRGSPGPLWRVLFGGQEADASRLVVSADGRQVAVLSAAPVGRLWLLSPEGVRPATDAIAAPDGVSLGPRGSTVVTWNKQGQGLTFWAPDTVAPWREEGPVRGVTVASWSPGGALLATADGEGQVTLWRGTEPKTTRLDGVVAADLRFSPGDAYLGASALDGSLRVWTSADGAQAGAWSLGLGGKFVFTSPRTMVAHAPASGAFMKIDLAAGATSKQPDCLAPRRAFPLALSPDASTALLTSDLGAASLCSIDDGRLIAALPAGEPASGTTPVFHPSGDRFASVVAAGGGSEIRVRDGRTGALLWSLPQPEVRPRELRFAFTAAALAVLREGRVRFYPQGECSPIELKLLERRGKPGWLLVDRDGRFDGDEAGSLAVWHRDASGRVLGEDEAERLRARELLLRGVFGAAAR